MKLGANLKFLAKPIRKIQIQCFQRSYMVPFALCLCVVQSCVADFSWGHAPYRHLLTPDTSPRQTKVQIQPKHRWANEFCWGTSRNMSKGLLTGTGRTGRHQPHQSPLQHGWAAHKSRKLGAQCAACRQRASSSADSCFFQATVYQALLDHQAVPKSLVTNAPS